MVTMVSDSTSCEGSKTYELPRRKRPKISELPLTSAQRGSIDAMLHIFKKSGEFDMLRKKIFQQYNESAQRGLFEAALRTFTGVEIERDPVKYLKPDRRMGVPLLEGAAARADLYVKTENDVELYINSFLVGAQSSLRTIRRGEVGEVAAAAEEQRGMMTDETYAAEADSRRHQREQRHKEVLRVQRKKEIQERKRKELEALRKKQEELTKETERLQREQKRRAEREAWKAAEKEKERERIKRYNEERERIKIEAEDREKKAKEEQEAKQKELVEREQKRLEQEALESLLREGREMAGKPRRLDRERDRGDSVETLSRLHRVGAAPRNIAGKENMRLQGLMPTSLTLRREDRTSCGDSETSRPTHAGKASDNQLEGRPGPSITEALSTSSQQSQHGRDYADDGRHTRAKDERRLTGRRSSQEHLGWSDRRTGEVRQGKKDEEGELMERSASSNVRLSDIRRARRESHSESRRYRFGGARSRSPQRYRDRSRRRERSRSPPGIDRYIPDSSNRRLAKDDEEVRSSNRNLRDENSRNEDRRRKDDRVRAVERHRPSDIDRYIPTTRGRTEEAEGDRRTISARSRDRLRHEERDHSRGRRNSKERSIPQHRDRTDHR